MIEGVLFLIVGALITALAYAAGNADHSTTAQQESVIYDQVFCR